MALITKTVEKDSCTRKQPPQRLVRNIQIVATDGVLARATRNLNTRAPISYMHKYTLQSLKHLYLYKTVRVRRSTNRRIFRVLRLSGAYERLQVQIIRYVFRRKYIYFHSTRHLILIRVSEIKQHSISKMINIHNTHKLK